MLEVEILPDPEAVGGRAAELVAEAVRGGLGADGHTASLVPGDLALEVRDRDVVVTEPYEGRRPMTLTFSGIARASRAIWLVTGRAKRQAPGSLVRGDPSIPATRVTIADQIVVADRAASPPSNGERS